ncbi:MAG TPA: ABC transporter ATP-binding protein [Streptomyces sp.]
MITVEGLTKTYGRFVAVDDVTFTCRPGRVTGFLGPNGAGKSTTMRIMVGLTPATRGQVRIGGHRYTDLPNPGRHVGVLLDASAQHAGRTGREVLTIGTETLGLPRRRVDEMLELVSLSPAEAKRRVRNYSLGMRQRLGIAHALLGDPSILVLDEPANGLDPAGKNHVHGVLNRLAADGATVVLSSHRMDDVEALCAEVTILATGRIVFTGPLGKLSAENGELDYRLRTSDPVAARGLVAEAPGIRLTDTGDDAFVLRALVPALDDLVLRLAKDGIAVRELAPVVSPLEAAFLALTEQQEAAR